MAVVDMVDSHSVDDRQGAIEHRGFFSAGVFQMVSAYCTNAILHGALIQITYS